MMHKPWSSIEEVPYYFPMSSVKFHGHSGQNIVDFVPNWAFPDCNPSLNSPMAIKWHTKLEDAYKRRLFSRSSVKFQGHTGQKIADFDPNTAFLDCNSSLNSPMAFESCTKLDVVLYRRWALLFFRVIRQISRSHGAKNRRFCPILVVSGM